MQRLVESHRRVLREFLEQRDKSTLVLRAAGDQIGYAVQMLRSIEQDGSPDVFLAFPQEFASPASFASLVAGRVQASELAAREELGEKAAALPPLPQLCLEESNPPELRLKDTLRYARSLLPKDNGQRLVCAFLPLVVKDTAGYGWLMRQIIQPGGTPPWYYRMRFVLREDTQKPMLGPDISQMPFVQTHEFDMSHEAMAASLEKEAQDEKAPREQRAQALLQLASLDFAHGRYQQALDKYYQLLAYYQETGNTTLQALTLNGIADIFRRAGDIQSAKAWYSRAIAPATESKSPVILFTLARNLAHTSYELGQYADAEKFFDSSQQLGLQVYDPEAKILALEWRALSQMKLGSPDRAKQSLRDALAAARQWSKQQHEERILSRLTQLGN